MNKKIIAAFLCFFSVSGFACTNALPTDDDNFCASFRAAGVCYCTASGVPAGLCQDMNALHSRMVIVFGSLQRACEHQSYTTPQDCVDNWNCYLHGGVDSQGRVCQACQ